MDTYLSGLTSSMIVDHDKSIEPYYIEHNIMTNDVCYSCSRAVSYCFSNFKGIKRWYCGYCATFIVKNSMNDIELGVQNLKLY